MRHTWQCRYCGGRAGPGELLTSPGSMVACIHLIVDRWLEWDTELNGWDEPWATFIPS